MTFELVSCMFRTSCSMERGDSERTAGKQKGVGSVPVTKPNRHLLIICLLEIYKQKCRVSDPVDIIFIFNPRHRLQILSI